MISMLVTVAAIALAASDSHEMQPRVLLDDTPAGDFSGDGHSKGTLSIPSISRYGYS
jgi:hypothetical protein